jgi:hypothetical protein
VIVERTYNSGLIMSILINKDILSTIAEDGATIENLQPDVFKDIWLAVIDDNQVIGVCSLPAKTSSCCEVHLRILKEHRAKYKNLASEKIEKWIIDNTPFKTVIAEIPEVFINVTSFMKSIGFIESGVIEKCWKRDGKLIDLIILSKEV